MTGAEEVFWRDLAEDMRDPEFRAAFEDAADDIANRLEH